jgi:hypothetical protein
MNQNLFRQFLYLSTSSFYNWVSVSGSAVHEAGPFTDQNLHSRDLSANIEFTVGRPWGNTSLITGYSARDLLFRPTVEEYFNTSSYAGLQHKFGRRLTAAVIADYLRSWRVQGTQYAIAQALLPGGRFEFRATPRWSVRQRAERISCLVCAPAPRSSERRHGRSAGIFPHALLFRTAAANFL